MWLACRALFFHIVIAKRHGKDDSCWLLIATHTSDLYRSPLEAPIWSVSLGMLVRMKIFLADLDSFLKSLEPFQSLKMDFWRRWRGERKMKKKIFFLLFILSSQTLRIKTLEFKFCANPREEDSPLLFTPWNHAQDPSQHEELLFFSLTCIKTK